MKFLQLTDAHLKKNVLVNLDNVLRIREHYLFAGSKKKSCTLIEFVRPDDYVCVQESYEDIKDIIEKGV